MARKKIDVEQIGWDEQIAENVSINGNLTLTGSFTQKGNQIKITSAGPTSLFLEADTDNTTETDTAYIKMSQDGGLVTSYVGHAPNSNADPENNTLTDAWANSLLIVSDWHSVGNPGQNSRVQLGSRGYDGDIAIALTIGPGGSSNSGPHVGIKTVSPKKDLHVGEQDATIRLGNDGQNSTQMSSHLEFCEISDGAGDMTFGMSMDFDATNNYFQINRYSNDTTGVNVMTILRDETKVGIGTVAPSAELDIAGNANISGSLSFEDYVIAELSIPGLDLQTDTNAFRFNCPYGLTVEGLTLYLDQHTTSGNVTITVTNTTDTNQMISLSIPTTDLSATTSTVSSASCDAGDIITFAITATPANAQGLRANLKFRRNL